MSSSLNTTSVSSCISVDTCSISIQTPNSLTAKTPRKRVLQERLSNALYSIKELQQQLEQTTTVEHCMKMCEQYLSPSVYLLVKNNIVNKDRSKSGQRYCKLIKQFALTV